MRFKREVIFLRCDSCGAAGPSKTISTAQENCNLIIPSAHIYSFEEHDGRDLCFNCHWKYLMWWKRIALNLYLAGVASLVSAYTRKLPAINFENDRNGNPRDLSFDDMPKKFRQATVKATQKRHRQAVRRGHLPVLNADD